MIGIILIIINRLMKTASIYLTDNQQSQLQFSNRQNKNLFISDFNFETSRSKKSGNSPSPKKQWIKVSTATESLQLIMTPNLLQIQNFNYLKKIFKRCVTLIRACIRLQKLQHQKQKKPNTVLRKPLNGKESLRDTVLNEIVFKWCRGICKKSLSSIKSPVFDYLKNPNFNTKADTSKMQLINAIKFIVESLAYYTHPHYIHYDLKGFLCSQLYQDYKLYFTQYVSERTQYKVAILDELQEKEAALIGMEIIIFNLAEAIIQDQLSCNFSKRIVISALQLLFKQYFDEMNCAICNYDCIQGDIKVTNNKLQLTFKTQHSGSFNLIDGLYTDEQISSLLQFNRSQQGKIQEYFKMTVKHLEKQIV
ncbi:unnamed protein product [Paramecium octaurelia]|uniref:Uncharacterized protein n=1 Tax=Paramecium octaurelia TaxID=43137 RepID=A0A8S1UAK7_PAROT|nr:unnamed protein product [Paramecium octaurelia]